MLYSTLSADYQSLSVLNDLNFKTDDTVVICLSGRGDKDLSAYMQAMEK